MNFGIHPLLLVTFFPLIGVLILALMKEEQKNAIRWTALVTSLVTFGLSLLLLAQFNPANPDIQLELKLPWVMAGDIPIDFHVGMDGISLLMVLLTTLLSSIALLSTWTAVKDYVKSFMMVFLLLETGLLGVFISLDLVLFYIFWEFTLIPMYFLIGVWGGERRLYASFKFFLFTMAGSVIMLLAILYMGLIARTFDWTALTGMSALFAPVQIWLFLAFALAFAIKVPIFPLHTWLPDAHVEAPTAGSVILAGVLLKMGAYGFLRFNLPLFPQASVTLAPVMAALAVVGIIYGALVAFAQKDLKKLVAYSSVSHMGFIMLGIFALTPQALSGGVLQMVNHGISTGALFLIVGMLYERRHTRLLSDFGGLWKVVPVLAALSLVVTLSSAGLPGTNGFIGEFTILLGSFGSTVLASPWFAGLAALGVILAAVYLLTMFEKVFLGPVKLEENRLLKDLSVREILTLLPLIILIFWIGLYPTPFYTLLNPTVEKLASVVQAAAQAMH
jgi:NADH-quinone oxidoreductase subunit M